MSLQNVWQMRICPRNRNHMRKYFSIWITGGHSQHRYLVCGQKGSTFSWHCFLIYCRAVAMFKICCMPSIAWGKALNEEKHCMRKSIAWGKALHEEKHCMPSIAWGKALHEEKPKCQWWWVYVLYCLFIYFLSAKPVTVLLLLFLKA